jgi:hypothetical protein
MLGCRSGKSIGWHGREPTIAEMLSDSMVKAVMRADGVDPEMLERELRSIARIVQVDRSALRSSLRKRIGAKIKHKLTRPHAEGPPCPQGEVGVSKHVAAPILRDGCTQERAPSSG